MHGSLSVVKGFPSPSPLSQDAARRYISPELSPILQMMLLADNDGWMSFEPETKLQQRQETLDALAALGIGD